MTQKDLGTEEIVEFRLQRFRLKSISLNPVHGKPNARVADGASLREVSA